MPTHTPKPWRDGIYLALEDRGDQRREEQREGDRGRKRQREPRLCEQPEVNLKPGDRDGQVAPGAAPWEWPGFS
jgi:hypothetical protein